MEKIILIDFSQFLGADYEKIGYTTQIQGLMPIFGHRNPRIRPLKAKNELCKIWKITISFDRSFYAEQKTQKHYGLRINILKVTILQSLVGSGRNFDILRQNLQSRFIL